MEEIVLEKAKTRKVARFIYPSLGIPQTKIDGKSYFSQEENRWLKERYDFMRPSNDGICHVITEVYDNDIDYFLKEKPYLIMVDKEGNPVKLEKEKVLTAEDYRVAEAKEKKPEPKKEAKGIVTTKDLEIPKAKVEEVKVEEVKTVPKKEEKKEEKKPLKKEEKKVPSWKKKR